MKMLTTDKQRKLRKADELTTKTLVLRNEKDKIVLTGHNKS
jgi:hypothetical protein